MEPPRIGAIASVAHPACHLPAGHRAIRATAERPSGVSCGSATAYLNWAGQRCSFACREWGEGPCSEDWPGLLDFLGFVTGRKNGVG